VRASPVFSATATTIEFVPDWLAPEVMVTNAAFDVAVHAQPLFVLTPTDTLAPVLATLSAVVESVKVHAVGGGVGDAGDRVSEHAPHSITTTTAIGNRQLIDRG
jgi:hypothetical protein